ncbi:MAG TPA: ATP-binding protein, partial [Xanthomonadales bacterium]|nr:ATP-binding protein [Xanthomonadales bacterium]
DMAALLSQLHEQAEELSLGRHTLVFEAEPGLKLEGAVANLESAFRNLIFNAIHYTPEGGRITVQWKNSANGPCFSVTDTGIGIPQRHIPRLTERFYRVSPDRSRQSGGTGLGLAIVKHVLNAHDAQLQIKSELGEGSVFTCQFPPPGEPSPLPELQLRPL